MKKKKVLIVSMTGGFGHIRAGEALLDFAKEHLPNISAEHVDIITINPALKKYTTILYDTVSKKFPFLWGIMYRYPIFSFTAKKIISFRGLFYSKIKDYIYKKNPDAIIFTNIVPLPLFANDCKKALPDVKVCVVVTDYHGHAYYNIPFIDYYFVANASVSEDLEHVGIKKEKIIIAGIPINPRFYIEENIRDLKSKYGIHNGLPVVLLIASFKISKNKLVSIVKQLLEFTPNINLICIANGNKEFYEIIKDNFKNRERFSLVHWTNVIEEYIKMSDVVISKAGGLTVSECVALQKPLIMVHPIPGQEEHNAEFIDKNNLGKKVRSANEIIQVLPNIILSTKNNAMPLFTTENPSEKIFKHLVEKLTINH